MSARRRLSTAAAVVALGALVFTPGAQACSCLPQSPAEALGQADAAIVARLVKVMPHGSMHADFRYRVQRVYRGAGKLERGGVISVRSARQASACGLPRHQERPVGLFLARDEQGRWTAGACSTIAPRRLGRAAKRGEGGGAGASVAGPAASCAS